MIALDTHALVWWVADADRLPARARRAIRDAISADERLSVSSISVWEIAMLVDRGRLELTVPLEVWLRALEGLPFLDFVAVDNAISVQAVQLPGFAHKDPADRIITATALSRGATLVTGDRRLRGYQRLQTVWD